VRAGVTILYHFSTLARLYPALVDPASGEHRVEPPELRPHAERMEFVSCVWLTTDGTSSLVDDPGPPLHSLRVAVRVPDTDRKLVSYRKWLRRVHMDPMRLLKDGMPEQFLKRALREWFLYLGTIPREWVVKVKLLPGWPWWLVE
jgi:hypothetical protein